MTKALSVRTLRRGKSLLPKNRRSSRRQKNRYPSSRGPRCFHSEIRLRVLHPTPEAREVARGCEAQAMNLSLETPSAPLVPAQWLPEG